MMALDKKLRNRNFMSTIPIVVEIYQSGPVVDRPTDDIAIPRTKLLLAWLKTYDNLTKYNNVTLLWIKPVVPSLFLVCDFLQKTVSTWGPLLPNS